MAKQFAGFTLEQARKLDPALANAQSLEDVNNIAAANMSVAARINKASLTAQQMLAGTQMTKAAPITKAPSPVTGFAAGGDTPTTMPIIDEIAAPIIGSLPKGETTIPKSTGITDNKATVVDAKNAKLKENMKQGQKDMASAAYADPASLVTEATPATITESPDQIIDPNAGDLTTEQPTVEATTVDTQVMAEASAPVDAVTYEATNVTPEVRKELDSLEAAKGLPTEQATVKGQLELLMQDFEEGKPTPPWAAGALRNAASMMASRGLGASSMAGAAATQAAMEAGTEIAVKDANTFAQFEMKNIDNEQAVRVLKSQKIIESMFSDQAADNVAKQLNAASENQVKQFYDGLATTVSQYNAGQSNAIAQFNAGEENTVSRFNAELSNQRDQFEVTNRVAISQANATWRQTIATTNIAMEQESNMQNARAATGFTTAALENLWQRESDLMTFAFTASESVAERNNRLVLQNMQDKASGDRAGASNEHDAWINFGKWMATW